MQSHKVAGFFELSKRGWCQGVFHNTLHCLRQDNVADLAGDFHVHVERRFSVSFGTPSWARHRPEECRATYTSVFRTGRFLVTSFVAFFFFFGQRSSSFFFSVLGSYLKYLDERILNFGSAPGLFTEVEGESQWRWPGCTWVSAAFLFRPSSRKL